MRRGVAVQPLELLRRDRAAAPRSARRRAPPAACGSPSIACGERDRVGRIVRHQLAQPVDLAVGHLQHAADVAQHGARLQLAEGDDLGDAVARRTCSLHIARSPRRGGPGRSRCRSPASTRARGSGSARTAGRSACGSRSVMVSAQATSEPAPEPRPGPTGMPLRLRPVDEVGDDQEVALKVHAGDDVELEGEPLGVSARVVSPAPAPCSASRPGETRLRLAAQLGRFGLALRLGRARAARRSAAGSAACSRGRKAQRRAISMVFVDRLGQVGEQLAPSAARS